MTGRRAGGGDDDASPDAWAELGSLVHERAPPSDARVAAASDPTTAPATLALLATAKERSIRRAVAQNPNATPKTLVALAAEFPDEFFDNPALLFYLLEDPAMFQTMPEEALVRLVPHPAMPAGLLPALARHPAFYVRRAAALNPRMPPEVLVELAEGQSFFEEVAQNPNTPAAYLLKLGRHDWPPVRKAVAGNAAAPEEALFALANDGVKAVRASVMQNGALTGDTLRRLAEHPSALARLALAESGRASPSELARLEADTDAAVRFAASRHKRAGR